jgi:MFS family permease
MMLVHRIIPFLIAIPLFLGVSGYSSVIIFLVLFAVFWFIDGVITLPWGELCARALKPELRGHMMGMQGTIGGVAAMLVGLLLTWLIATPLLNDEHRFAFIFSLASAILLMTAICIRLVRDPNPMRIPEKPDIRKFYAQIPSVLRKCMLLRYAIIARMPSYLGFAATSFLIVFGVGALDLSDLQVSLLVYSIIFGGIVGGITAAEASRRFGNRAVILLSNFCVVAAVCMAILLAFVPSLGYIWLFAICVLGSISLNNWIGYFNYFIDIAPVEDRSAYQLLGQAVGIPFSFAGLAMGAVVDRFGFVVMFVICGIFAVAAVLLSLKLLSKREVEDRVEL